MFSLGISEMNQATCDSKVMLAKLLGWEEVRKLEENDRQEAMAQLSSAVKETADMVRKLKRKVADLENRSKLKK